MKGEHNTTIPVMDTHYIYVADKVGKTHFQAPNDDEALKKIRSLRRQFGGGKAALFCILNNTGGRMLLVRRYR